MKKSCDLPGRQFPARRSKFPGTADVVDVGEGAGHRLSLLQEIDSFECRESLANAEGFPCKAARRALARLEG